MIRIFRPPCAIPLNPVLKRGINTELMLLSMLPRVLLSFSIALLQLLSVLPPSDAICRV